MNKNEILPLDFKSIQDSTNDWEDAEFGAYMRLLMKQWSSGGISSDITKLTRIATTVAQNWPLLKTKFKEVEEGKLQNPRMEAVRKEWLTDFYHKPTKKKAERKQKITTEIELIFPYAHSEKFMETWSRLVKQPKWKKKTFDALQTCLMQLSKATLEDAIQMMNNTIAANWQGLFELRENKNGQGQTTYNKGRVGNSLDNKAASGELAQRTEELFGQIESGNRTE